jgi:hypothetical protein
MNVRIRGGTHGAAAIWSMGEDACVLCVVHSRCAVQHVTDSMSSWRNSCKGVQANLLSKSLWAPKSLVMHESTTKASLRASDCATDIPFTVPDPPLKCPEYGHAAQTTQGQD